MPLEVLQLPTLHLCEADCENCVLSGSLVFRVVLPWLPRMTVEPNHTYLLEGNQWGTTIRLQSLKEADMIPKE
jgi:hypothetical protein